LDLRYFTAKIEVLLCSPRELLHVPDVVQNNKWISHFEQKRVSVIKLFAVVVKLGYNVQLLRDFRGQVGCFHPELLGEIEAFALVNVCNLMHEGRDILCKNALV
jgi:hypothetical protein